MLLAIVLAFSLFSVTPSFAAEKSLEKYFYYDVEPSHSAYVELERFLFADLIDGYEETDVYEEDGETYEDTYVLLKPQNYITRAQFTKILVNAMNLTQGEIEKTFTDVKSSSWFYDYVKIASSHGIILGKEDGTFKPNDKITRAQMAMMIYRAFKDTVEFEASNKTFKDVSKQNVAYEAIHKAAGVGIVKGYGDNFKPGNLAFRSHAVLMIDRAMHLEAGAAEDEAPLLTVVERNITTELALYDGKLDTVALEKLYRETATGYYLASSLFGNSIFEDPELDLTGITMQQIGQHTTSVASVNKRFASVRIDNYKVRVTFDDPEEEMSFSMTMNISGTAFLKKMADGSWKIYHILYDDEDYNLQ